MVHYIIQVQYYILFEVIECAFENFMKKFANATTIEEVIRDHEMFIQEIKTKTLKDGSEESRVILCIFNIKESYTRRMVPELFSHPSQCSFLPLKELIPLSFISSHCFVKNIWT